MKKLNGYSKAQTYTENEKLPVGGYVLKILDVQYRQYSWGDVIILSFDVAEGEQKGFFDQNYRNQTGENKKWKGTYRLNVPKDNGSEKDEWTMRRFKTTIVAIEDSNPGYHWDWDEKTLKGKMVGGIFNNKEYEINGRTGFFTNCHHLTTVDQIRSGKFKIPADSLLDNANSSRQLTPGDFPPNGGMSSWMNVPDSVNDSELPFN